MPTPTLDDQLDHLSTYAGMFITHWMDDDGNDADDKARCIMAEDAREAAETALRASLDAARAMLAALKGVVRVADRKTDEFDTAHAAIAQAKAAGITL